MNVIKRFSHLSILILIACSAKDGDRSNSDSLTVSTTAQALLFADTTPPETSTFDVNGSRLQRDLKTLYDSGAFSKIHSIKIKTIPEHHQEYFASRKDYVLLFHAHGDLFQNKSDDYAFVIYDSRNIRISIMVYDALKNQYRELYRDIKIKDGLKEANCNYGSSGTLDDQLANEIIYHSQGLIRDSETEIESFRCKILDIAKDEDFVLDEGCFAAGFSQTSTPTSLCLPTSFVYNNWECLVYDKTEDIFVVYYGQAFAD